jgi:hypothetical protein
MRTPRSEMAKLAVQASLGLLMFAASGIGSTALGAGLGIKSVASISQARTGALIAAQHATPAPATPASAMYQFVTIDVAGATLTVPNGVNDTGLVSGTYIDANFNFHGFLWRDGTTTALNYPQSQVTLLAELSDAGIVIGNYGGGASHAVLYDVHQATWQTLPDISNQPVNLGDGINNRGVGTGAACQGTFLTDFTAGFTPNCIGWTWNGKEYSFFEAPGADGANGGTVPDGINDMGKVVGTFVDSANVIHGFVKDGDDFSAVDVPGALLTAPLDINDSDEIVGYYVDANGVTHGFVEKHGQFTTVDVPNSVGMIIFGNDSRGDIAGSWVDSNFVTHGFVGFKKECH